MIDANVVGSGPNGLAAAVTLAAAGLSVRLTERADTIGGGMRTEELTLPGFRHDLCSAVHPAALASPFFRAFGLTDRVPFVVPDASYAHPLDAAPAGVAWRDLDRTADELGADGPAWRRLFAPLVARIDGVVDFTGSQLLRVPRRPVAAALMAARVLEQGTALGAARFRGATAPAMLAGAAAHAIGRHPSLATAAPGVLLGAHAHAGGWGVPVGGSQAIADALAAELVALGGEIVTGHEVRSPADLERSRVTLLDTSVEALDAIAGHRLPAPYRRALRRYRHGDGVAKVDFALSDPVPWADPRVGAAPTVHLGGSAAEIAASEHAVAAGRVSERPYVLVVQPTVVDPTRAPAGRHTLWAYIHVPRGSRLDATELVAAQMERFAPGFRDTVLASTATSAVELGARNPNDVGGDILGGALTVPQLVKRPVVSPVPWRTPVRGLYLCSASTPPGPSVQGMNGWFAARLALREHFGVHEAPYNGRVGR
ncbi:phytoene desaturase family protein [Agromyces sp. SYSU T00194]|uniref:phytoene desaturase family protein n=1 Tax=Agromyces chitinivorans TaxID=3158560 RepID=UPI003393BDC4